MPIYTKGMLGFNHTLSGSIVAVITPAPLVPIAAFSLHLLLDATPHFGQDKRFIPYNRRFKMLLLIDATLCFLALFLAWWLFPDKWLIISVGTLFATLPDFMWLVRGKTNFLNGFFRVAEKIQWAEHPRGWLMELLYALSFGAMLFWLA